MSKAYKNFNQLGILKINGVKQYDITLSKAIELIKPICKCK